MKQYSNMIIAKINAEIETSCIDSDISSDKALHMITAAPQGPQARQKGL